MVDSVDLITLVVDAVVNAVGALWWALALAAVVFIARLPVVKGWFGEAAVNAAAWLCLDTRTYRAFHDVTLAIGDGTTQIDHVFASPYGILVVETKNMKGWIFGAEHQSQWTQKIYRHSYKFQNPLRQNYKHTKTLQDQLEVPEYAVKSIVVFVGDCKFKTDMPPNVVRGMRYIRYIKQWREHVLSNEEVERVCSRLSEERLERSAETRRRHIGHVRGATSSPQDPSCPTCGAGMIQRKAKRGASAGRRFWGCSRYPACRGTKEIVDA